MANWGIVVADIKNEIPVLLDSQVQGTWSDSIIQDCIEKAYYYVKSELYDYWGDRFSSWDASDDPGVAIRRLVVIAACVFLFRRMSTRSGLTEEFDSMLDKWLSYKDTYLIQIKTGLLRVDNHSEDLSTNTSAKLDPTNKYEHI